jgi:hypothetical protein
MQQVVHFLPLLKLSRAQRHLSLDPTKDLYVKKARVAGREYIFRVADEPFDDAEHVVAATSDHLHYLLTQFDDFGVISLQHATAKNQSGNGVRMLAPPNQTWYHCLPIDKNNAQSLCLQRKVCL